MPLLAGRCESGSVVGAGGMGRVVAAHDHRRDRPFAARLIHDELLAVGAARERLLREARAFAQLHDLSWLLAQTVADRAEGGDRIGHLPSDLDHLHGQEDRDQVARAADRPIDRLDRWVDHGRLDAEPGQRTQGCARAADLSASADASASTDLRPSDTVPAGLVPGPLPIHAACFDTDSARWPRTGSPLEHCRYGVLGSSGQTTPANGVRPQNAADDHSAHPEAVTVEAHGLTRSRPGPDGSNRGQWPTGSSSNPVTASRNRGAGRSSSGSLIARTEMEVICRHAAAVTG